MRITPHGRRTATVLALAAVVAALVAVPAGAYGTGDEPPTHDHGTTPDGGGGTPGHDGGGHDGGDDSSGGGGGAAFGHGAALTGAAEAPGPGDPDGAGLARVALDPGSGQACLRADCGQHRRPHRWPTSTRARPGWRGRSWSTSPPRSAGDDCVGGVDGALLERITANPAGFYVNVHNVRFPAGAVRGQLFATEPGRRGGAAGRLPARGHRRGS